MTTQSDHCQNLDGAAWMICAMAAFAVEDALVKAVSDVLSVGRILTMFGLGGALLFAAIAYRQGDALLTRDVVSLPMRLCVLFEIAGRLFYVLALALIPLSTATVILHPPFILVHRAAARPTLRAAYICRSGAPPWTRSNDSTDQWA